MKEERRGGGRGKVGRKREGGEGEKGKKGRGRKREKREEKEGRGRKAGGQREMRVTNKLQEQDPCFTGQGSHFHLACLR